MLKKIRINKKGESGVWDIYNFLHYLFVRTPFLIAFAAVFMYVLYVLSNNSLDSHHINNLILDKRIIYSPSSLAYQDKETGRVYPGIIDLSKAEQTSFEKAFVLAENDKIATKIEISSLSGELLKELYINKDWYDRWSPLSSFPKYSKEIYQMPVQIKKEAAIISGAKYGLEEPCTTRPLNQSLIPREIS